MSDNIDHFSQFEAKLPRLVDLCKRDLEAEEVWLFGSRARGDHRPDSDWDILAIIRDDASEDVLDPITIWKVGRASGVMTDLLAVKKSDYLEAQSSVTTLSHLVATEGIRLDV